MKRSNAPPPIKPLEGDPHPYPSRGKRVSKPPPGMVDVRLAFPDEFAPSNAQAFSSDPDAINNPCGRHIFYNQHLYEFLPNAISEAVKLGLPSIEIGFPLTFAKVSKTDLSHIFTITSLLSNSVVEGNAQWLCVQCYIQYALMCNALTELQPDKLQALPGEREENLSFRQRSLEAMIPVSHGFFLGAALRQLELSLLNRNDALRGKKTIRSAKAGGELRKSVTAPQTEARLSAMRAFVEEGKSINNAARLTANKVGGTIEANKALWKRSKK